ncbi:hypothetical protein [Flavobacterium sp. AG291]|uniref:hypothetical protein n=1 Tax=Flavobacterium sp. AG291 TaxID=2184000 RepID=UPI000E2B1A3C|nr:hypothetical protein [Flavobacterium sp. AG291]RDI14502.1 hypothetical protein DEU42_102199 [Flavobacterium sp. AG291]
MQSRIFKLGFLALLFSTMLTSCELVGDIFQAGMGVGIFIVIAVIVLIVWVISRFRK